MEHVEASTVAFGRLHAELSGGKCKQVRRKRRGFGKIKRFLDRRDTIRSNRKTVRNTPALGPVGYGPPVRRHSQDQLEARLEIRLIETRECQMRPRRNKKRIQEIVASIERPVARYELNIDGVLASASGGSGDDEVTAAKLEVHFLTCNAEAQNAVTWLVEIEHNRVWPLKSEADRFPTPHGFQFRIGNLELEIVTQRRDCRCAVLRQLFGNTGSR